MRKAVIVVPEWIIYNGFRLYSQLAAELSIKTSLGGPLSFRKP
jgi:hypothetical protein